MLRRQVRAVKTVTVGAASALVRAIRVRRAVTVTAAPVLARQARRRLTTAVHAAVAFTSGRVLLRAFTVAVNAATVVRRRVGARRTVAVTAAATLRRRVFRRLAVAVAAGPVGAAARALRFAVAVTAAPTVVTNVIHIVVRAALRFGRVVTKWGRGAVTASPFTFARRLTTWVSSPYPPPLQFGTSASRKWTVGGVAGMTSIPAVSTEYVRVQVTATSGGVVIDPTGFTVSMAFLSGESAEPASGDWKSASWDTLPGGGYVAQCLVGPGGAATPAAGTWWVWVRVVAAPETVVRQCGWIQIV